MLKRTMQVGLVLTTILIAGAATDVRGVGKSGAGRNSVSGPETKCFWVIDHWVCVDD